MEFELIDSEWDELFKESLKKSLIENHSELSFICPFIKKPVVEKFLKIGKPHTFQIITRYNLGDFYNKVSDISALRLLLTEGAKVRGVKNLHSKVYIFGQNRAIVTSANLTDSALKKNHEFGFVSDDPKTLCACRKYFQKLWQQAGPDLAEEDLDKWEAKLKKTVANNPRPSLANNLPDEGADIAPPLTPFEEAPQAFVKFFGSSDNRKTLDTLVLDEVKHSGSHWACAYPKNKRPRQPQDGDVMFMGRMVKEPNDTIIYGRAISRRYKKGRDDATPADIKQRPRKERYPHYIRVHSAEFISSNLENGVSLNDLMEKLQAGSFETTKKNSISRQGNTDPRKAYRQQPHVKLSDEGKKWLNDKLERVFRDCGKIGRDELNTLDWPKEPN